MRRIRAPRYGADSDFAIRVGAVSWCFLTSGEILLPRREAKAANLRIVLNLIFRENLVNFYQIRPYCKVQVEFGILQYTP